MIKLENTEVYGWKTAIHGMRNPMNSWDKSDSRLGCKNHFGGTLYCDAGADCPNWYECYGADADLIIGPADLALMKKLANAGSDHRKFLRFITATVDITAPLYWWKEFDTYKVGTVANSCSTMHKIHEKEFTLEDFSHEQLIMGCDIGCNIQDSLKSYVAVREHDGVSCLWSTVQVLLTVIKSLNANREAYLETKDKRYWWQMIQLLPTSYNQRRTVLLNYEVLRNMYHARKAHKLDEWREGFCGWVKSLPYAELITGDADND